MPRSASRKSLLQPAFWTFRGTLCPMRGGRYHNLQSWEGGRNLVRYVPVHEVRAVRKAVEGYRTFMDLARQYADWVIRDTRKAALLAGNEPKKVKKKEALAKPPWHGRPARETRARCPCHARTYEVLQAPQSILFC